MSEITTTLFNVIRSIGLFPIIIIIFIIGMYIFWRECRLVKKDNNSVFDIWFINTLVISIWSRIAFILANPTIFENVRWFYLPYERFNETIYLFRSLPWKFFAIWDGGFLFTAVAFAYLFSSFIAITMVKKWSWKEMLNPVVISSQFMLSLALIGLAILINKEDLLLYSFILFFMWLIYAIYIYFAKRSHKYSLMTIFYTGISFSFIGIMFWIQSENIVDRINTILLILMVIIILYLYVKKDKVENVIIEDVSNVRPITITANKAIKLGGINRDNEQK